MSFLLLEQPEDLGRLATGPYKGQRPASMWQWPAMSKVAKLPKVTTLALHQNSFGTSYPKPMRLLLLGARHLPDCCYVGPPTYDNDGSYVGPLPRLYDQSSMRDRATSGPFRTTGTEQWPIRMCQWMAAMLLDTCSATATAANEGQDADKQLRITEIVTQSASQKAVGYKVERVHPGRARHSQATRRAMFAW